MRGGMVERKCQLSSCYRCNIGKCPPFFSLASPPHSFTMLASSLYSFSMIHL